tara:strand:+ start:66 stop:389 length:324 start_codon:yes stop_codon:yes gene_type:complete
MIYIEDAEKALEFLKSTDVEAARLRSHKEALDDMKKTALAMIYNEIKEGSAADKLKRSEGDKQYKSHLENLRAANEKHLVMMHQRNTAQQQIDMWRSINSNQRKGNI